MYIVIFKIKVVCMCVYNVCLCKHTIKHLHITRAHTEVNGLLGVSSWLPPCRGRVGVCAVALWITG